MLGKDSRRHTLNHLNHFHMIAFNSQRGFSLFIISRFGDFSPTPWCTTPTLTSWSTWPSSSWSDFLSRCRKALGASPWSTWRALPPDHSGRRASNRRSTSREPREESTLWSALTWRPWFSTGKKTLSFFEGELGKQRSNEYILGLEFQIKFAIPISKKIQSRFILWLLQTFN